MKNVECWMDERKKNVERMNKEQEQQGGSERIAQLAMDLALKNST
jgi:hypothetical protein